jgi:hypothetical protein
MLRPPTLLCVSLALIATGVCAAPLARNSDFSAASAAGVPEGWVVPAGLADMVKVVDDDGHSGNISLRLQVAAGTKPAAVTQPLVCQPNTEYVLSAWLKSADLRPVVSVVAESVVVTSLSLTDRGRWQGQSVRFNSGRATQLTVAISPNAGDAAMPTGTAWVDDVQVWPAAEFAAAGQVSGGYVGAPPGPNIALGKPYTLSPAPNYSHSTDPDDKTQLTDGEYSIGYFWTQKSTVGWSNAPYADITVDLGQVYPIKGCSYNTAAGVAGVAWPALLQILVSEDGKVWYSGGDLIALSAKFGLPPEGKYATHRYVTDDLKLHGRYFRLLVAGSGSYTFCDEIEVYQGPDELMTADMGQPIGEDPKELLISQRVVAAVRARLLKDIEAFKQEANAEGVSPETKAWADKGAVRLTAAAMATPAEMFGPQWRAIHPLTPTHAEIYKARARIKRELGAPTFAVWQKCRWDMLDPMELPGEKPAGRRVAIHTLSGGYRAEALNLTNMGDADLSVSIATNRLPGGAHPDYLSVQQVEWIETQVGIPVADALPLAEETAEGWQVTVPAGMTRQIWLTFHPTELAAGSYGGSLVVQPELPDAKSTSVPVQLRIYPGQLPEKLSCSLGMWDYSCGKAYDMTDGNVDAAIANMKAHFLNTPWASSGCAPWPKSFDGEGNLAEELDFDRFDGWVADWADATNYAVFLSVGKSLAGVAMDDLRFPKAVGEWMHAWVKHLRELDVEPSHLLLLLVDEPSTQEPADIITAWASAINAAEPEVVVWEDPTFREPEKLTDTAMFDASDVLCPNLGIFGGGTDAHRGFYENLRQKGKTLWFYQCSGPAKTHDPYYYHRLQHWYAFKYGAVGSGFWAYADAAGTGTSWNELRAPRSSYTPVYIDETSVTDGKHFEAVREGLEDYELLEMLRNHADKLAAEGKQHRADEARKVLQAAIDDVCGEGYEPGKIPWIVDKDRTRADAARVRILKELTR